MLRKHIAVIGAGSWGTTLADLLAKRNDKVVLWAYEKNLVQEINKELENGLFLPGIKLSKNLQCTNDLAEAVTDAKLILFVTPTQVTRKVLKDALLHISTESFIVSASKGIEVDTLSLVSKIFEDELTAAQFAKFSVISGPSFAREVAAEMPTAVAVAAVDSSVAEFVQKQFNTPYFRVYTNNDLIGVELGGSVKNVIALASGITEGLGYGHNTRAALITRGLAEMTRLGLAMGGKPSTFAGLAGVGDLVLTCTGDLSRNRSVGIKIGKGKSLQDIINEMIMIAEGVQTTVSAHHLAIKMGVEMPIITKVYEVLYKGKSPLEGVIELMTRDLKAEHV